MKVGDLVHYERWFHDDSEMLVVGILIRDHSPMRPPHVCHNWDVVWSGGEVDEVHSDDMEVLSASR